MISKNGGKQFHLTHPRKTALPFARHPRAAELGAGVPQQNAHGDDHLTDYDGRPAALNHFRFQRILDRPCDCSDLGAGYELDADIDFDGDLGEGSS